MRVHGLVLQGKGAYCPFFFHLAQSIRKPDAERGLHNGGRDGNAIHSPQRANQIRGRCGHGVIWEQRCEQSGRPQTIPSTGPLPAWSNVASEVKRMPGYTIPWPRLAGKIYTRYFHDESSKPRDVTRALPITMRMAPTLTRVTSFPHLDMTTPAIRPPIGVARDGIASRAPAVVAESSKTTWKKRGRLKRYCDGG